MSKVEAGRVLLAEDDESVAGLVLFKLKRAGFDITHVVDGTAAAQALAEAARTRHPFAFAILDGRLPGRDGVSVMEECAAFAWTDGGILASADELAGVEIPAGWTRLRKPFDLGELLDAVRTGANLRSEAGEEERVLLRLKAEFVATFPAKISELERLLRLEDADERRMAFGSLGHKLSGAAGLYQFQNLYQAAVALEETGSDRAARTVIEFLKQP